MVGPAADDKVQLLRAPCRHGTQQEHCHQDPCEMSSAHWPVLLRSSVLKSQA